MVKKQKHKRSYMFVVWIGLSIGVVVILFLLLGWVMRNGSLYEGDIDEISSSIKNNQQTLNFPGNLVFSEFNDDGCDSRNSGMLTPFIHCGFSAYKYFKSTGDLASDMQKAEKILSELGWQRDGSKGQDSEAFEATLEGKDDYLLTYENKNSFGRLFLSFYKDSKQFSDHTLKELVKSGAIPPPQNNEHIYGFRINATYWSCSSESFFKQPCPDPPSEPR